MCGDHATILVDLEFPLAVALFDVIGQCGLADCIHCGNRGSNCNIFGDFRLVLRLREFWPGIIREGNANTNQRGCGQRWGAIVCDSDRQNVMTDGRQVQVTGNRNDTQNGLNSECIPSVS